MSKNPMMRSPLSLLALVILAGSVAAILGRIPGPQRVDTTLPSECEGLTPSECQALLTTNASTNASTPHLEPEDLVLSAEEACPNAGYLCAEVEENGFLQILRWQETTELIRVLVPEPEFASPQRRQELQRAAIRGIRAWHGHPFPLSIRTRDQGAVPGEVPGAVPHVSIEWRQVLEEGRLGRAQIQWIREGEEIRVNVLGLTLATQMPGGSGIELTPRQVELVAAHEMGHVLGLPHSDDRRDLMYPQNTASQLSARDFRTLNAIYELPNGVKIRR